MGQRLNIEIWYKDECIANSYYHWSAYSTTAANIVAKIVDTYNNSKTISPIRLAVELLESTNAGINDDERSRIELDKSGRFDGIEFKNCVNRNEGILAVTNEGIQETRRFEEGRVEIHLDSEIIGFYVYFQYSDEDELDGYPEAMKQLPAANFDFDQIRFRDFEKLPCLMDEYPDGFKDSDGVIYHWIE